MGLLDGILSNVLVNLGSSGGGVRHNEDSSPLGSALGGVAGNVAASALVALAFRVLQQNGGIGGLVEKLRSSGLGQHASSWVSNGENQPVSGDQLQQALGSGELAQLASRFGLTPEQASNGLAQVLPDLVNQLTPAGQVPADDHNTISDALATLKRRGIE